MEKPKEEPNQLFTKGDKVLFTGKMLDENVVDKVVTVFYTLGRGEIDDMSDIMDEYTHVYRVWNKDLKHTPKEEPKPIHEQIIEHCGGEEKFMEICGLKPKQETLEEAAEKTRQESFICCSLSKSVDYVTVGEREKVAFIEGAKWQQEQYEILFDEYHEYTVDCIEVELKRPIPFKSWVKQFKNK